MKKMTFLALALASAAMFALPAVASAGTWHLEKPASFSGTGGTMEWKTTSGVKIHCTTVTISGEYETTTAGWMVFTLHGCKGSFGTSCTSLGHPAGTIMSTTLLMDNVILETAEKTIPGVLLTPNLIDNIPSAGEGHFAAFSCLGIPTVWRGSGLIGEVTAPKCGETSESISMSFASSSSGHQKWTQVTTTGTTYGLTVQTAGGAYTGLSMDTSSTVSLSGGGSTMTCT